ncbi:hypothetical protein Gbth_103_002 [Gluconobacter thailandicus F149-1 = NBRC 100600]|uniref:DUF2806 domain-containing protein n=1 Tax=Gluconobacter thailandicus NBRC 3257 TaxID=1381097 RepID=A0ABQ0IWB6_GLUTH|nr:DUF2806 domain-containing protein [Gluconobacter thailandicus]GAC89499.1 hypothetical protein NBRC3255_3160 [Gluconobacter thailandicus NBRC 3255]GAD26500.1 hypothetical protein NBRC3257_1499 [Gluconobacter thailandicus NBRC 3257]GAN94819.1 hypothetical protein Gbth_103_002 [Gluconobacter thailandicus F149-1 = NBRC 100600]GBR60145.1 hypothetical protein AA100600_1764 [Gluconobacter thailandicus F149-1 = NBRC 100600]GEL88759.1 hypothetical protein GTH01_31170 [Gluconobacter thailandicus F149
MIDLPEIIGSGGALWGAWHTLPQGVRTRCLQGIDSLTGRLTHRLSQESKKKDAHVDDEIKREEHQTDAQKNVLELLVPKVAERISADPILLEQATIAMMGKSYQNKLNTDSVINNAFEDISKKYSDSSDNNDSLDEDWLNIFSSHAEKASSERARQLWGRILSGEVRHPGSFSLSTLRILSEIDKSTAEIFVNLCPIIFLDFIIISRKNKENIFSDLMYLQEYGILKGVDSFLSMNFKFLGKKTSLHDGDVYIDIEVSSDDKLSLNSIVLTRAGKELFKTIDFEKNYQRKIEEISSGLEEVPEIVSYKIHKIIMNENGIYRYSTIPDKVWSKQK